MHVQIRLLSILLALFFLGSCSPSTSPTIEEEDDDDTTEEVTLNPKKGFGITINDNNNWFQKLTALDVSWHYSWGNQLPEVYPHNDVEFVPMIWGAWGDFSGIDPIVDRVNQWAEEGKVHYLLGFNEPDAAEQANLSVDDAIQAWPKLMEANVPLVSPAPVHADREWLKEFMERADELDYRVDFIGVHWYRGPNPQSFLNHLHEVYELYGLPIWITEFAVADWQADTPSDNRYTTQQIISFMAEVLPALDELDFVYRYAWFNSDPNHGPLGPSALFNSSGELTQLGRIYRNHQ